MNKVPMWSYLFVRASGIFFIFFISINLAFYFFVPDDYIETIVETITVSLVPFLFGFVALYLVFHDFKKQIESLVYSVEDRLKNKLLLENSTKFEEVEMIVSTINANLDELNKGLAKAKKKQTGMLENLQTFGGNSKSIQEIVDIFNFGIAIFKDGKLFMSNRYFLDLLSFQSVEAFLDRDDRVSFFLKAVEGDDFFSFYKNDIWCTVALEASLIGENKKVIIKDKMFSIDAHQILYQEAEQPKKTDSLKGEMSGIIVLCFYEIDTNVIITDGDVADDTSAKQDEKDSNAKQDEKDSKIEDKDSKQDDDKKDVVKPIVVDFSAAFD